MTFLTKGNLISKVAPKTYRVTAVGRKFLADHPRGISLSDLEAIPGWEEAWNTKAKRREAAGLPGVASREETTSTPDERIEAAKIPMTFF